MVIIIIIIGYTLEYIIESTERRLRRFKSSHQTRHSRLEWSSHDILQIQRIAHEEIGIGTWSICTGIGAVSLTEKNRMLAVLDTQDTEHPRLKAQSMLGDDDSTDAIELVDAANAGVESEEQDQVGCIALTGNQ